MQTTPAATAINIQLLQALVTLDPLVGRIRSNDSGSDRWEETKRITDQARAAIQAAIHQDVLEELRYAHKIIMAALSVMDVKTKSQFAIATANAGVDGEGTTRANERLAVIQRAEAFL